MQGQVSSLVMLLVLVRAGKWQALCLTIMLGESRTDIEVEHPVQMLLLLPSQRNANTFFGLPQRKW